VADAELKVINPARRILSKWYKKNESIAAVNFGGKGIHTIT
jgi:hypothetical protein